MFIPYLLVNPFIYSNHFCQFNNSIKGSCITASSTIAYFGLLVFFLTKNMFISSKLSQAKPLQGSYGGIPTNRSVAQATRSCTVSVDRAR